MTLTATQCSQQPSAKSLIGSPISSTCSSSSPSSLIHHHDHIQQDIAASVQHSHELRTLTYACLLTTFFFTVELAGGYFASSLAIMSDAAHLLSDLASFVISLIAVFVSRMPANTALSFGFSRTEVLGAFMSIFFIWALTAMLVVFAFVRLFNPTPVNGPLMLILGLIGLAVNILLTTVLGHSHHGHSHSHSHSHCQHNTHEHRHEIGHGHEHNHGEHGHHHHHHHDEENPSTVYGANETQYRTHRESRSSSSSNDDNNVNNRNNTLQRMYGALFGAAIESVGIRAAYLHAVGDMLQSIGVIIAAIVISIDSRLSFVDPLCTLFFAVLVVMTTTGLARETLIVLMEGTPPSIHTDQVYFELSRINGVSKVGDLHIWSISPRRPALSVHVYGSNIKSAHSLLKQIQQTLASKFGITHATVQINCMGGACCDNAEAYLGTPAQRVCCLSFHDHTSARTDKPADE